MKKTLIDPKNMVLDAIKSKLSDENIQKIIMCFDLHGNEYSVHLKPKDSEKAMTFDLEKKDTSMIKRMFVNKIKRKIENVENYKHIMLCLDIDKDNFDVFLENYKNEVTKFEIN